MPNRCRELPRTVPGHQKPTLNRSRDPLRTPCGAQGRSESIPRASWKPLGAPERAQGLLGESPKVARDARKSARERPATLRGRQNRCLAAPGDTKREFFGTALLRSAVATIFRRCLSIFGLFAKSANPSKYRARRQNQGFSHLRYESCRSRNVASKNNENRWKTLKNTVRPAGRPRSQKGGTGLTSLPSGGGGRGG